MSGPKIKPCGTPYVNVPASEKNYQYRPNIFCFRDRTHTI